MSRRAAIQCTRIAIAIIGVGLLEALCRSGIINERTMIPPSEMAGAMIGLLASGEITGDIARTFSTVALAFVIAVALGFATGAVLHEFRRARRAADPLLASYYAVPVFVFYPLLVALFGLNILPLVAIGVLAAAPAMTIGTLTGFDRVPRVLRKVARAHRLGAARTLFLVVLPAAMPGLLGGLKLALAYAFIGVIAGEFILSSGGLGYGIAFAYDSFDNRGMYGRMLFVLLVAIVANGILAAWETRLLHRRTRA
ncbi:MAG TPA: ABC transporter permease subunit [Acetobacteraceae bacterium]